MKIYPPKWANRFLEWYCQPDLLEEIQGDAYELYYREAKRNERKADWKFAWNVMRFFRWRNIHKQKHENINFSGAMLQNTFKVAMRNFFRQPGHSLLNVAGLAVSFVAAFLIGLWIFHEISFDRFHDDSQRIFKVMSHVDANGTIETYSSARASINLAAIPDVTERGFSDFAYRVSMPWWIFGSTIIGLALLIVLIVCAQGVKTIRTNPTEVLSNE
jgi:hypothetical protein